LIENINRRVAADNFLISKHAEKQRNLRGQSIEHIKQVILFGEVIRTYPHEKPYPEYLFLGYIDNEPCYVVVASNKETVIVTVHNYDPDVYEPNHQTRRKK